MLALVIASTWLPSLANAASAVAIGPAAQKFMTLSLFATGRSKLDPEIGAKLFAALRDSDASFAGAADSLAADAASGKYPDVESLEAAMRGTPKHAALLALVSAWYTGTVSVKGKPRVITMSDALLYQPIADGSHIPGNCEGATNSWDSAVVSRARRHARALNSDSRGVEDGDSEFSRRGGGRLRRVRSDGRSRGSCRRGCRFSSSKRGRAANAATTGSRFMSLPASNRARGDMQSPFPQSPYAPFPMFGNDDYLILKGRDAGAFRQGYLRVVGGTTWHWSGPVLAAPARRSPPEEHLRSRPGLADFLRRTRALLRESRVRDGRLRSVGPGDAVAGAALGALRHGIDRLRNGRPPFRRSGEARRLHLRADSASEEQPTVRRSTRLLRQQQLHADLPDRRALQRHGACQQGNQAWRGPHRPSGGLPHRHRCEEPRDRRPLLRSQQAIASRDGTRVRHRRERHRDASPAACTRPTLAIRAGSPTAPTRWAAT